MKKKVASVKSDMKKLVWSALVMALSILTAAPDSNAQAKPAAPAPAAPAAAPAAAPGQATAPAAPQGRKKRVAIFDFDYATVQTSTAALFGTNVDVGKGISDLLVTDLVKDGTYSVIERKALDKILTEQNFFEQRPRESYVCREDRETPWRGRHHCR